jgi:hypothetical protein
MKRRSGRAAAGVASRVWFLLATTWLAAGWAATARGGLPEYVRRLRPEREPKTAARIEAWRGRLDESLRERFNFAWCIATVDGVGKMEYIAHSGVGGAEDLSEESWRLVRRVMAVDVPGEKRHYETFCVNRRNAIDGEDCWDRDQDTEFKILEAITARLGNRPGATGVVALYTDLPPCASCQRVIEEFQKRYPGLRLAVLYK